MASRHGATKLGQTVMSHAIWRAAIAVLTGSIWVGIVLFDPQAMERPGSPVDGLVGVFLPWIVIGVLGAVALLPFAVRRHRDWSHTIILSSVAATATVALFHAIASAGHVAYAEVEWISTPAVCIQGLALLGCAVGLVRLATLPKAQGQ